MEMYVEAFWLSFSFSWMYIDWLFQVTWFFHSGCQLRIIKSPGELRVFLKDLTSFQCLMLATLLYWNQMLGTTCLCFWTEVG